MNAQDIKFNTAKNIIVEAIARLRKNKGCDIEFENFRDTDYQPSENPLALSVCFLKLRVHGQNLELAMQSNIFTDTSPHTQEEENILLGTNDIYTMLVLRVAKIVYEQYKNWLRNQGLANKITTDVTINSAAYANIPVYVDHSTSSSKLYIGNQVVDISDTVARDTIQKLHDDLDMERQRSQSLQSKVDYMEAVLRSKGLL